MRLYVMSVVIVSVLCENYHHQAVIVSVLCESCHHQAVLCEDRRE